MTFKHGSRGSRKHHTVPRLLHTAFQPDAVRHSRYCLPPQRLLLAGRAPAKSSPKLKGVRTTAAIIVTVRNALWIDISRFFSGCSACCSVIFLAICSILELELPCLRYLQHCRLKVSFLFRTFAHKSDSHLETGAI